MKSREEYANSITHGFGFTFGLVFLPLLCIKMFTDNLDWYGLPSIVYSFCFLFLFASSTIYHLSWDVNLKKQLQKLDHISIYFMIAGTYTPFIFSCLEGSLRWIFLAIMWTFVIVGAIFKVFFTGKYEGVSLILYLLMGWMVIFIIKPFLASFSPLVIGLVVLGGIAYTAGVYFYVNDHKPYRHFIWHLFVLVGAISHSFAIYNI